MARREAKARLDISSSRPTPPAPVSGTTKLRWRLMPPWRRDAGANTRRDGARRAADFVGRSLVCSSTRRPVPSRHPPAEPPSRPHTSIRPSLAGPIDMCGLVAIGDRCVRARMRRDPTFPAPGEVGERQPRARQRNGRWTADMTRRCAKTGPWQPMPCLGDRLLHSRGCPSIPRHSSPGRSS